MSRRRSGFDVRYTGKFRFDLWALERVVVCARPSPRALGFFASVVQGAVSGGKRVARHATSVCPKRRSEHEYGTGRDTLVFGEMTAVPCHRKHETKNV